MNYKFQHGIAAGTFDNFHMGHKMLLDIAFSQSNKVSVYITNKKFSKSRNVIDKIESYITRKRNVLKFLESKDYLKRANICKLFDIYGDSLGSSNFDAIFVSKNTLPNAQLINAKRTEKGLSKLSIIVVPFALSENKQIISSYLIRKGEIDGNGNSYFDLPTNQADLKLPTSLKKVLRKPHGKVYKTINDFKKDLPQDVFLITVGDIVSKNAILNIKLPEIMVIDNKTQRKIISDQGTFTNLPLNYVKFENKPGTINRQINPQFKNAVDIYYKNKQKTLFVIRGEEDLLALPIMVFAPLNSVVLYGLYNQGIVAVLITTSKKKQMRKLLGQFN